MMRLYRIVLSLSMFVFCIFIHAQETITAADYVQKAQKGDAFAQYHLAICYEQGRGVDKDEEQAAFWYHKAAEQGYAPGQYMYGICLSAGRGVLIDKAESFLWVSKAAEQGYVKAQFYLGTMYQTGEGVAQDDYKGFGWVKKAAEQGNVDAQYNVGYCYYNGEGVEKDINQTIYWWKKSAEGGDEGAQNALGFLYETGQGIAQDYAQAAFWYRKAADQEDIYGQSHLGKCYYDGKGVPQDYSEAVKLFRKAASKNDDTAQYYLGLCYQNGQGVERDASQAIYWYEKAANQGYKYAPLYYILASHYKEIKDYNKAHDFVDKAHSIEPYHLEFYDLKGEIYYCQGNMTNALEIWQYVKEIFPDEVNEDYTFCSLMIKKEKEMENSIDYNIPVSKNLAPNTFAFIIANESYKRVSQVPFAQNDGNIFAEYCKKTVGIPENNVRLWNDATLSDMQYAITKIKQVAEAYDGEANIILYYAGHGIPSDDQKNSYLLPIDGYGADESCISLHELYETLGMIKAKSVFVILDACFSGAQRDGEMLASTRGVAIKPKQETPEGNLVVLSAAQGDETAMPYTEMSHGLFSYFLLKKLRESEGNCTIGELSDYVITNVKRTSVSIGDNLQTPKVTASTKLSDWRNITLK